MVYRPRNSTFGFVRMPPSKAVVAPWLLLFVFVLRSYESVVLGLAIESGQLAVDDTYAVEDDLDLV